MGMYLDRELAAAFEKFLEESKPPTTKVGVIEMLLTAFLTERGYWPPKKKKGAGFADSPKDAPAG